MQKRIIFTALTASLLLVFSSFVSAADVKPRIDKIRIGIAHGSFGTPPRTLLNPLAIAQRDNLIEDEFAKDGIAIEWIYFKGAGPAVNEAISNEQIDFALQGDLPSIVGRAAGLKTRILMPLSQANTYIIVKNDSDIYSLSDLKHKRLAFHKGTNMHVSVNKILHAAGLRETDIKFFNLDTIASIAAFHSGDLDGMFGGLNFLNLVEKGHARLVYSTQDENFAVTNSTLLGTDAFITKHPELTQRLVTTIIKAVHIVGEPDNYADVLDTMKYGYITPDIIRTDLHNHSLAEKYSPLFDERFISSIQRSIEIAEDARLIRRPVQLSTWIDPSFLNNALKELNLTDYWTPLSAADLPNLAKN